MDQLYHLHPIFEFFLTSYFALIVAPQFLDEFLVEKRIQKSYPLSKENAINRFCEIQEPIRACFSKYCKSELKTHIAGKPIRKNELGLLWQQYKEIRTIIINVSKHSEVEFTEEMKNSMNYTFENMFLFTAVYCFVMLLLNGYHETEESLLGLVTYLSYFNFIAILFLFFLSTRKWIFKKIIKNTEIVLIHKLEKIELTFFYTFLFLVFVAGLCFIVFPNYGAKGIYNCPYGIPCTLWSSIVVSAYPLMYYGFRLNRNSKDYFFVNYRNQFVNNKERVLVLV